MTRLGMGLLCALLGGCYIQGQAGYYVSSYDEGTADVSAIETDGGGPGFGLSLGVEVPLDMFGLLTSLGYGAAVVPAGDIASTGGGIELEGVYTLKKGKKGNLGAGGMLRMASSGDFKIDGEDSGDDAEGGLDLFAGAYYVVKRKGLIAVGLGYQSREAKNAGSITAFGPEARLRYTWYPKFGTWKSGGGGGSGGVITGTIEGKSFAAYKYGSRTGALNAVNNLNRGARKICQNTSAVSDGSFTSVCDGETVAVVATDDGNMAMVCDTHSETECKNLLVVIAVVSK